MAMIWEQTRQLEGETLYTVYRHKPFNIINVHEDRVTFVPQDGKGTHRWVRREQIERIFERVHNGRSLDRQLVQEHYPNDYNTSYITAIVKRLFEVLG